MNRKNTEWTGTSQGMQLRLLPLLAAALLPAPALAAPHADPGAAAAVAAVKARRPPGAAQTIGQVFAESDRLSRQNHLNTRHHWSAARKGKGWIVTQGTGIGNEAPLEINKLRWRVTGRTVAPLDEETRGFEADVAQEDRLAAATKRRRR